MIENANEGPFPTRAAALDGVEQERAGLIVTASSSVLRSPPRSSHAS